MSSTLTVWLLASHPTCHPLTAQEISPLGTGTSCLVLRLPRGFILTTRNSGRKEISSCPPLGHLDWQYFSSKDTGPWKQLFRETFSFQVSGTPSSLVPSGLGAVTPLKVLQLLQPVHIFVNNPLITTICLIYSNLSVLVPAGTILERLFR